MTASYTFLNARIDAPSSTIEGKLGQCFYGAENQKWVYDQPSGAIDQYDCVTIDENFQATAATQTTAAASHLVGWAQVAFSDNEYGYVVCQGTNFSGNISDNASADAQLYFSGTAGFLNTVATMGGGTAYIALDGVVVVSVASGGGASELLATYPVIVE